jgi:transcription termination factor NusB
MNPYISTSRIESYTKEFVNSCCERVLKKKASKEDSSYSSVMRELRKSYDEETVHKFQREFKDRFDAALVAGVEDPEKEVLDDAMKCITFKNNKLMIEKIASAIDLGDPEYAGKYLSDVLKFVMRRISQERRVKSLENLRKKIYYLNEYEMAAKRVPPSSAIGQSITLLKHILLEHDPKYIRAVLNSVVKYI